MPENQPNRQIFSDRSGSVIPWNQVKGSRKVEYSATRRRGVDLNVGAAEKFVAKMKNVPVFAQIGGEVTFRAQAQAPLDLFDEAGLAVRLQAIARLAAGIGLRPRMSVRDLTDAVGGLPDMKGAPMELFQLLLGEITIQGEMHAQAAVAIMAYANLVASGTFLSNDGFGKPGFQYIFEAGYGFKVGGGYRAFVEVNFDNPRRLINRYAEAAITQMIALAGQSTSPEQLALIRSLEAPVIIGARLAYEIGELPREQAGERSIAVIILEGQRWLLKRFRETASNSTVQWTANNLLTSLNKHMESKMSLYPFNGPLEVQVPSNIANDVNTQLGRSPGTPLSQTDLITYLTGKPLQTLLSQSEDTRLILNIFQNAFPGNPQTSAGAIFAYTGSNPSGLLTGLTSGLQAYAGQQLNTPAFKQAVQQVASGSREMGVILQSGLIPSLEIAASTALPYVMNQSGYDRTFVREALSSALLAIVGRGLVRMFNGVTMHIQGQLGGLLNGAANQLSSPAVVNLLELTGPANRYLIRPLQAGFREAADQLANFIPQRAFDQMLIIFTPIEAGSTASFVQNLRKTDWSPRAGNLSDVANTLLTILMTRATTFTSKIIAVVLQAFLEVLLQELRDLIDKFGRILNEAWEALRNYMRTVLTEPLRRIIRELVGQKISVLPPRIQSLVTEGVDAAINSLLPGAVLDPIMNGLSKVTLDPKKVLDTMTGQGNFPAFTDYLFQEILQQLRRSNLNLNLSINVPIKLPGPLSGPAFTGGGPAGYGGIGGLGSGSIGDLGGGLGNIGGLGDAIGGLGDAIGNLGGILKGNESLGEALDKILNNAGLGGLILIPGGKPQIALGVTLTPEHIVRAIREAVSIRTLQGQYRNLRSQAAPALQKMQQVAEFQAAIPRIVADFQINRSSERSLGIVYTDALILLRPLPGQGNPSVFELLVHFPGLRKPVPGIIGTYPQISVVLDNCQLPLNTFQTRWNDNGGIQGRPPGLTLRRTLTLRELRGGTNMIYTAASAPYFGKVEAATQFRIQSNPPLTK
ncbi:hypothetical protein ACFC0X_21420 [Paenibacillus chitinolyticus]|uniref:hypothetical protein n=1 Tax=Paenibacillus chitinolyticus TaxID=79263 RepID=UPI0035D7E526